MSQALFPAHRLILALLLIAGTWAQQLVAADLPFLHQLFTDHAVLQRDLVFPVWGWTTPGSQVGVSVDGGKVTSGKADEHGRWEVKIGPFPVGGPHTLTASGEKSVTISDILFGDVWLCSGQSNMSFGIGNVNNAKEEIAAADHPQIRLFSVPQLIAIEPQSDVKSQWQVCTPATVSNGGWGGFTAVGYFFGRDLNHELNIPIGLIHSSWGGTIAEAWTSADALMKMVDFKDATKAITDSAAAARKGQNTDFAKQLEEWWNQNDPGTVAHWQSPDFDDATWPSMKLPVYFQNAGLPNFNGVVWFRKEITLAAPWTAQDLMLHLGPVDDADTTFVNGVVVGGHDQCNEQRDYSISAKLLKTGKNVIVVRVLDTGGMGGIYGKVEDMRLECPGQPALALAGPWQYHASTPWNKTTAMPKKVGQDANVVTVLYNGMIANLEPFAIKGAIWYQGESNAERAEQYRQLLPTLIGDWRAHFPVGDFPFYIVQLANWRDVDKDPEDTPWANLRDAQATTAFTCPNCGLALAIDIGDNQDIHPKNKQEVGHRLALNALAKTYGKQIEYQGPVFQSASAEGQNLRLTFTHLGGGLVARSYAGAPADKLTGFAISSDNSHFVWADARIDGDSVVLSSPMVANPVAVRYAWGNNPVCNLYNKAGLPAVPFRGQEKKSNAAAK